MDVNQGLPPPAPVEEAIPPAGVRGSRRIAAIAAGAYTDIVSIYGPAEAVSGEKVTLQIVIRNLLDYGFYIAATVDISGVTVTVSPDYAGVDPGATATFSASFFMPNKDITVDVWSWFYTGTDWVSDDHEAVVIKVKALPSPEFSTFGVTDYSKT